jgi:hypothetical protein
MYADAVVFWPSTPRFHFIARGPLKARADAGPKEVAKTRASNRSFILLTAASGRAAEEKNTPLP